MNAFSVKQVRLRSGLLTFSLALAATGLCHAQQHAAPVRLPDSPDMVLAAAQAAPLADAGSAYSSSADTSEQPDLDPQNAAGQNASGQPPPHTDGQTTRILGILPNFRSVSADTHLPPQSVKDKFVTASQDSFDYSSIFVPALVAVYNYGRNNDPEFGSGGVGYGRYFWHSVVDQTQENYFVEFIVPAIAHEDTRFYTLGKGGFRKRIVYSFERIVVTRSDSGKSTFNSGEIVGAGLSSAVANLYYPSRERTFGNTITNYGINLGIDALSYTLKEFWPDINHALFHGDKPIASSK